MQEEERMKEMSFVVILSFASFFVFLMRSLGFFSFGGLLFQDPLLGPIFYEYTHAFGKITLHPSKTSLFARLPNGI